MPKPYTFPTLYDEVRTLDISDLKKWGYLDHSRTGTVTWSRNGEVTSSIGIASHHPQNGNPYINLNYINTTWQGEKTERNYKILLVWLPSNLGKGKVWYFHCPHTGKRCRKLYSIGSWFLHREAFNGCMYESQTHSKKWRQIECVYGAYFDSEKYYEEIHSKHFKTHYKGKPTKRYLKLLSKIRQAENIDYKDIELLMMLG